MVSCSVMPAVPSAVVLSCQTRTQSLPSIPSPPSSYTARSAPNRVRLFMPSERWALRPNVSAVLEGHQHESTSTSMNTPAHLGAVVRWHAEAPRVSCFRICHAGGPSAPLTSANTFSHSKPSRSSRSLISRPPQSPSNSCRTLLPSSPKSTTDMGTMHSEGSSPASREDTPSPVSQSPRR